MVLVYFFTYLSVRSFMGKGVIPFFLVPLKYLIYWKLISVGFKYLPALWIMVGIVSGVYLGFPFFYWINRKYFSK